MPQPAFIPSMAAISAKPNILRSGLPLGAGSTVNGDVQAGPAPSYLGPEVLINVGTRACYQFSDVYCYAGAPTGAAPAVSAAFATNLANNHQSASLGAQAMTYGRGGIQFTAAGGAATQAINFNVADVWPSGNQADNFVSTIWLGLNGGQPAAGTNCLLFTYPDGSTWNIVDGVYTFKPINQPAIPVANVPYYSNVPLQLGYELDLQSGAYDVVLYVNGQVASSTSYNTAYVPPGSWPATFGFGPNSTTEADQFAYTAMRFYLEDLTQSQNAGYNVAAADYLMNYTDLVSQYTTGLYPTAP
jgi:hypothetical protein